MNQRDFRARNGMSISEFAKRIGVGWQAVWRYETIGRVPTPRIMRRIQKEFPQIDITTYYSVKEDAA